MSVPNPISHVQNQNFDLRQIIPAIGLGVVIGAGGVLLVRRFSSQESNTNVLLKQAISKISQLRLEWIQFKEEIQEERRRERERNEARRSRLPTRRSYATTSGSEDEFEEAQEDISPPEYITFTTPPDPLLYKDARVHQDGDGYTAGSLIEEADQLFLGSYEDIQKSLVLMEEQAPKFPDDSQVLWRVAKAKVLVGEIAKSQGDDERQKELVYSARDDAKRSVELDDMNADAHKYYSIVLGIISDWVPLSEAMGIGKLFKIHLEKALELKPDNAYISHLYGRFIYTLANMGWIQRKAVVSMYGLTEPVSLDTALKWFQKAESLEAGFSNCNPFYMAQCYIKKGITEPVVELLEKTITTQGNSVEEVELREKARQMLEEYR